MGVISPTADLSELLELASTLRVFISCVEKFPNDAVAGAVASKAKGPLQQVAELCVHGVLIEMKNAATEGDFTALLSAVWFVREFCETSPSARKLVQESEQCKLLGSILTSPQAPDHLIKEAKKLLYNLHDSKLLLETIPQALQGNSSFVIEILWELRDRHRSGWADFPHASPKVMLAMMMSCIKAFPHDWKVHEASFAILSDMVGIVEYRTAFAECDGYSHVFMVLEANDGNAEVHKRGLHILCELQRGGSWVCKHLQRCQKVVLRTLEAFHGDESVLEWGLWLLIELGGLHQALAILERNTASSTIGKNVIDAFCQVHWGETEGVTAEAIPEFLRVLGACAIEARTKGAKDTLGSCIQNLLDAACYAVTVPENALSPQISCGLINLTDLVLDIIQLETTDDALVKRCLGVVRLFQEARGSEPIRQRIHEGLFGGSQPSLVHRLMKSSPFQDKDALQEQVLWAHAVILGPCAILEMMRNLSGSLACSSTSVKILGQFFGEEEDLDDASSLARVTCLQSISQTMEKWPQSTSILSHSCYAISALAAHGVDACSGGSTYNIQHVQHGLKMAWAFAAPLAAQLDAQDAAARPQARYLRQEIIRLETESIKAVPEPLRQDIRNEALRIGVAAAQCQSLLRDAQAREIDGSDLRDCLRMALVDLGVLGKVEYTVHAMRELRLVKGASAAAVDLCRLGLPVKLREAGLVQAAFEARSRIASSAKHLDAATQETMSTLQLAEDFVKNAPA